MADGGLFLPEEMKDTIIEFVNSVHVYYDPERDCQCYMWIKGKPKLLRKYPWWKFWNNTMLERVDFEDSIKVPNTNKTEPE